MWSVDLPQVSIAEFNLLSKVIWNSTGNDKIGGPVR